MQEQLVDFETAMLAEEKGFKENTFFYYIKVSRRFIGTRVGKLGSYDDCSRNPSFGYTSKEVVAAPTLSHLQKWLREVHNIHVTALPYRDYHLGEISFYYSLVVDEGLEILCNEDDLGTNESDFYETYEEALETGLKQALKLIK